MSGELNPETKLQILDHHRALRGFLNAATDHHDRSASSRAQKARQKLLKLSPSQFSELSTDVYDELQRRTVQDNKPDHLLPKDNFHVKRNQARQKLANLSPTRFTDLVEDILHELERREYHITSEPEPSVAGQKSPVPSFNFLQPSHSPDEAKLAPGLSVQTTQVIPQKASIDWSDDEESIRSSAIASPRHNVKKRDSIVRKEAVPELHLQSPLRAEVVDDSFEQPQALDEFHLHRQQSLQRLDSSQKVREMLHQEPEKVVQNKAVVEPDHGVQQEKTTVPQVEAQPHNPSTIDRSQKSVHIASLPDKSLESIKRKSDESIQSREARSQIPTRDGSRQSVERHSSQIDSIKRALSVVKRDKDREIAILLEEGSAMDQTITDLENQNTKLVQKAETLNREAQELREINSTLSTQLESLKKHIDTLETTQVKNKNASVEDLHGQFNDLNQKLGDLSIENENLKQLNAELELQLRSASPHPTQAVKKNTADVQQLHSEIADWKSKYESVRSDKIAALLVDKSLEPEAVKNFVSPHGLIPLKLVSDLHNLIEAAFLHLHATTAPVSSTMFADISAISEVISKIIVCIDTPQLSEHVTLLRTVVSHAITAVRYYSLYASILPKICVESAIAEIAYAVCNLVNIHRITEAEFTASAGGRDSTYMAKGMASPEKNDDSISPVKPLKIAQRQISAQMSHQPTGRSTHNPKPLNLLITKSPSEKSFPVKNDLTTPTKSSQAMHPHSPVKGSQLANKNSPTILAKVRKYEVTDAAQPAPVLHKPVKRLSDELKQFVDAEVSESKDISRASPVKSPRTNIAGAVPVAASATPSVTPLVSPENEQKKLPKLNSLQGKKKPEMPPLNLSKVAPVNFPKVVKSEKSIDEPLNKATEEIPPIGTKERPVEISDEEEDSIPKDTPKEAELPMTVGQSSSIQTAGETNVPEHKDDSVDKFDTEDSKVVVPDIFKKSVSDNVGEQIDETTPEKSSGGFLNRIKNLSKKMVNPVEKAGTGVPKLLINDQPTKDFDGVSKEVADKISHTIEMKDAVAAPAITHDNSDTSGVSEALVGEAANPAFSKKMESIVDTPKLIVSEKMETIVDTPKQIVSDKMESIVDTPKQIVSDKMNGIVDTSKQNVATPLNLVKKDMGINTKTANDAEETNAVSPSEIVNNLPDKVKGGLSKFASKLSKKDELAKNTVYTQEGGSLEELMPKALVSTKETVENTNSVNPLDNQSQKKTSPMFKPMSMKKVVVAPSPTIGSSETFSQFSAPPADKTVDTSRSSSESNSTTARTTPVNIMSSPSEKDSDRTPKALDARGVTHGTSVAANTATPKVTTVQPIIMDLEDTDASDIETSQTNDVTSNDDDLNSSPVKPLSFARAKATGEPQHVPQSSGKSTVEGKKTPKTTPKATPKTTPRITQASVHETPRPMYEEAELDFDVDAFDIENPDNTLSELLLYLEHQTVEVISTIQSLLTSIKHPEALTGQLRTESHAISRVIGQMVDATSISMDQSRNHALKEHGTWVVQSLADCRRRMIALCQLRGSSEEIEPRDEDNDFADKHFKQRLAGISFDVAKCTKELVKSVEEASLNEEIAYLNARLNH